MMKRILIVMILFGAFSLGGINCSTINDLLSLGKTVFAQKEPRQNINESALEYMEQKYGEKFEFVAPWGDSMTGNHELIVSCESLPDKDIIVKISNYRSEDKVYQDNYVAVKYCEETAEFLGQCANEVYGDSKVYYSVARRALSPELPADASFEEYLADEEAHIKADIVVKASSFTAKEQVENVTDPILSVCKSKYVGVLVVMVDDAEYEFLDKETLREIIIRDQYVHCARLTKEGSNVRLDWLEED